jgi:hypothetical protein
LPLITLRALSFIRLPPVLRCGVGQQASFPRTGGQGPL